MSASVEKQRYVLLLRGINVGGNNKLPMKDLKESLACLGLEDVSHYIQSGNIVFSTGAKEAEDLEGLIEAEISKQFGFSVPAMVLTAGEFERAVQQFPFAGEEAEKAVLVFLSGENSGEWADRAEARTQGSERYERDENVAYLYCPDGLARSKAAEVVLAKPRAGVKATMRNWRTVNRILAMLAEMDNAS